MPLKIHEEIESEEDWLDSLAYEVKRRIDHKRQLYLEEWMEIHRAEHPEDDPGVRRRLGEIAAKRKAEEFFPRAMSEVLTSQVIASGDAVYKRVAMLVNDLLPKPQKRKQKKRISKRKTKAQLRAEAERANDSLHHGTRHGEFPIPGVTIKRAIPRAASSGLTRKKRPYGKKRRMKQVVPGESKEEPIYLTAREIVRAVALAQERDDMVKRDFPGPIPKQPKTATFGFMSEVPKKEGMPRKNWRKEVGT